MLSILYELDYNMASKRKMDLYWKLTCISRCIMIFFVHNQRIKNKSNPEVKLPDFVYSLSFPWVDVKGEMILSK